MSKQKYKFMRPRPFFYQTKPEKINKKYVDSIEIPQHSSLSDFLENLATLYGDVDYKLCFFQDNDIDIYELEENESYESDLETYTKFLKKYEEDLRLYEEERTKIIEEEARELEIEQRKLYESLKKKYEGQ